MTYPDSLSVGGGIRTRDLLVRSQTLYPAELHPHMFRSGTVMYYTRRGPFCQYEKACRNVMFCGAQHKAFALRGNMLY